jgi:ribonucleoside-diphosphate reductase alpha chain
MARDGWKVGDKVPGRILHARYSRYMRRLAEVAPEVVKQVEMVGARFTHHSSIAPTGTISLSLANNAVERHRALFRAPLFPQRDPRGEEVEGARGRLLVRAARVSRAHQPARDAGLEERGGGAPDYFVTAESIGPREHVEIQAAAQKWVDSSISKTANVPTNSATTTSRTSTSSRTRRG